MYQLKGCVSKPKGSNVAVYRCEHSATKQRHGVKLLSASPMDFDERWLFGTEYRYKRPDQSIGFALRGGYKMNHDTEDYSFGGGINFSNEDGRGVRADYAYKHFTSEFFDAVQMFTVAVTF